MRNYDFGTSGGSSHQRAFGDPEDGSQHRNSVFSLAVTIIVVAVAGAIVLGVAFWALGFLFSIAGWILRVAILAAVAAFVWRRINRHRSSGSC